MMPTQEEMAEVFTRECEQRGHRVVPNTPRQYIDIGSETDEGTLIMWYLEPIPGRDPSPYVLQQALAATRLHFGLSAVVSADPTAEAPGK